MTWHFRALLQDLKNSPDKLWHGKINKMACSFFLLLKELQASRREERLRGPCRVAEGDG